MFIVGGTSGRAWSRRFFQQLPTIVAFGINFGIVPFVFDDPKSYDALKAGDRLELADLRAAVEGNGQSELLEAITGMRKIESGSVMIRGKDIRGMDPGEIRSIGLAHIPEDRIATGVCKDASVSDNLLMGKQR